MRARDPLWDALVDALGLEPLEITPRRRGKLNAALKELRAVHASPEEVARRARAYRYKYPGAALSELALADHWAEFAPRRKAVSTTLHVVPDVDPEPARPTREEGLRRAEEAMRLWRGA